MCSKFAAPQQHGKFQPIKHLMRGFGSMPGTEKSIWQPAGPAGRRRTIPED